MSSASGVREAAGTTRLKASAARRALVACGGVLAVLAVLDLAIRVYLGNVSLSPGIFRAADTVPGYELKPFTDETVRLGGRETHIRINGEGHRVTTGAESGSSAPAATVHLIGDSQVFGWGLDDSESIASQLQARLGREARVLNHGVPGTGPLDYSRAAAALPRTDWVVIALTDENDLWDAYGVLAGRRVRCGYLALNAALGARLPCWAMRSRLVQLVMVGFDGWQRRFRPTPLQYNPHSAVAAGVLMYRVGQETRKWRAAFGDHLIITYVPWVSLYDSEQARRYFPRPSEYRPTVRFPDDCDIARAFEAHRGARPLYLAGDAHLSAFGASVMADAMAAALKRRMSAP